MNWKNILKKNLFLIKLLDINNLKVGFGGDGPNPIDEEYTVVVIFQILFLW